MNLIKQPIYKGISVLLLFLMILIGSCDNIIDSKDYDITGLEVSPTMALPLAYGSLSIQDFLNKEDTANIKIDGNDVVYYLYEKTLISHDINGLFNIPDLNSNGNIIPLPPIISSPGTYPALPVDVDLVFPFDKEKITEILFKQGSINLTITNPYPDIEVEISLPDFSLNGVPFKKRVTNGAIEFPLAGYLYQTVPPRENKILLQLSAIANNSPIVTSSPIQVDISFSGMDYKSIRGFFGDQLVTDLPDQTLNLNVFNTSFKDRDVSIATPLIFFRVTNDYGVPLALDFITLQGKKSNGDFVPMILDGNNPFEFSSAPSLGDSSVTDIGFINTSDIIDFAPTKLYYQVNAQINKGITSAPPENFSADTSKFRVKLHVELPLFGRASNIIMADTIDIDLADLKTSEVESFFLKIRTTNQLPVDANLQLYLADSNAVILDSLFNPNQAKIIQGSKVNSNGELESTTESEQIIDVPKDRIDNIFKSKKLIINARLNTIKDSNNSQPNVKFKSKYKMNVNIGLNAKLKLKVDL